MTSHQNPASRGEEVMTAQMMSTPLWATNAAGLEALLRARSAGTADIRVHVLGSRDELSADPQAFDGGRIVHVSGSTVIVGPASGPGSCPQCVARRWQASRPALLREATELGTDVQAGDGPPLPFSGVVDTVVAVLELVVPGQVAKVDVSSLDVTTYDFLADPYCPTCGASDGAEVPDVADRFVGSRKRAGYRSCRVEDYPLPLEALANPVSGVLGRGYFSELSLPSTAAIWGSFSTRTPFDMYEIFWGGHASSYDRSLRIGLLEGLERYAGMIPPSTTIRASRAQLVTDGIRHLDPRSCGLYDEEYHRRTDWLVRYSDDLVMPWVPSYSVRDRGTVWLPEVTAYYRTGDDGSRFVQECSNGCASGGNLTEATYCGLMELIERDAFLLTWYGKVTLPEIDAATSNRASTRMMIDRLAMYGYRARFFDARISFDIPVVIGVAERIGGGLGAMCVGGGSGLDPEDAIAGALVEISTDSLNLRSRVQRDHDRLAGIAENFDLLQSIHDHPILFGLPQMARHADFLLRRDDVPPRSISELYGERLGPDTGDLADDLTWCVEHVAEAGLDTLVVDQTTIEQRAMGVHTASVIVPGLLPIDFGWGRQRCLDMPRMRTALREAGLATHDLTRADLHLVPHPFP